MHLYKYNHRKSLLLYLITRFLSNSLLQTMAIALKFTMHMHNHVSIDEME